MNIAESGVSTQLASQRVNFAQSQIKQSAESEKDVANLLTEAAQEGSQADPTNGRGQNINISV
jgi:hypothetical protein